MNRPEQDQTLLFQRILGQETARQTDFTSGWFQGEKDVDTLREPGFRVTDNEMTQEIVEMAWNRLREQLTFVLASQPDLGQSPNWEMRLCSSSVSQQADVLVEMRQWLRAQPERTKDLPIFELLLATSERFEDWMYRINDPTVSPNDELPKAGFRESEKAAILFLNGFGVPHLMFQTYFHTDQEELARLLPVLRAGVALNEKQWNDPKPTQEQRDTIAHLEWHRLNSAFDEKGRAVLSVAHDSFEVFGRFFLDKDVASWTTFLQELTINKDTLKKRWSDHSVRLTTALHHLNPFQDVRVQLAFREFISELKILLPGREDDWRSDNGQAVLLELDSRTDKQDGSLETLIESARKDNERQRRTGGYQHGKVELLGLDAFRKALNAWAWDQIIEPVSVEIDRVVNDPNAIKNLSTLGDGPYKDFMRYAYFLKVNPTPEFAYRLLERAPSRFGNGCDVNQSHGRMNEYVKSHYQDGTHSDPQWRMRVLRREYPGPVTDLDELQKEVDGNIYISQNQWHFGEHQFVDWHKEERVGFVETSSAFQSAQDIYIFTDEVKDTSGRVVSTIPSNSARLMCAAMNPRFAELAMRAGRGESVSTEVQSYTQDVVKFAPEAHLLRDFFLENAAHLQLDRWLKMTFSESRLKEEGMSLEVRTVNLHDVFGQADPTVLRGAYMIQYPLARVRGLDSAVHGFTFEEKRQLADLLFAFADGFSPATRAVYERLAAELEMDLLKDEYRKRREHFEQTHRSMTPEMRGLMNAQAFDKVLERVLDHFPRPSHHRDSVLRSLVTDVATTAEQADRLQKLTFTYHERHPSINPDAQEKNTFSASETMKDYLAMFTDRNMRKDVLLWFFGGAMPPDRYLEGKTFQVNEQEKVRAFWAMSSEERRTIFYSALLGEGGLFQTDPFTSDSNNRSNEVVLNEFVSELSKVAFEDAFEDPEWKKTFTIIFKEVFCQYSAARRVELFCSMSERLREFKLHGKKFTSGEAMRLLLEQVGVVGVKTGQVLAEQPDILDEKTRQELSKLKDGAQPFDKQGVFSYVRSAGWYEPSSTRPVIAEVGALLGSASIKQVHLARTVDGEDVALKIQRPNIVRNFQEDMRVLNAVVSRLRDFEYDVPEWLVKEVHKAVEREMDFGFEARVSERMSASVKERGAGMSVNGREFPIHVPTVRAVHTKESNPRRPMQLMIEEFAHGLTLEDIRRLQEPSVGTREEVNDTKERIREKLHRLYGAAAPAIERQYAELPIEEIQSQVGIELLYQIASGDVFHADLHAGNIMINLTANQEQVTLIDLGSTGEGHPDFLELTVQVLLLKQGMGNSTRVAEILSGLSEEKDVESWKSDIEQTVSRARDAKEVFTNVLALVLKKSEGNVNHDLRMLFKALSAAGGHLQILSDRLTTGIMEGMMRAQVENRTPLEVLVENTDIKKLLPLAPRLPMLASLLGF